MKKTFEISYKLRYGETEDWGSDISNPLLKNKHLIVLQGSKRELEQGIFMVRSKKTDLR